MKSDLLCIGVAFLIVSVPSDIASQELSTLSAADVAHGERLYAARCSRCHGLEGFGGEGPVLARPFLNYARDDETLVSVIMNGIRGTGMPRASLITELEARQIAAFVRTLGRIVVSELPTGNPIRGEALYRGKGECTACHGSNGIGNQFGPDLTKVGVRRNVGFIRDAIVDPGSALPQGLNGVLAVGFREYLPIQAVQSDGNSVRGHRINESSFTILVRDGEGQLHSFQKNELAALTKQFGRSLMPSYRRRFSDGEVDDLVAYLLGLRDVIP